MTQFSYTPEALARIIERPQDRAAAVEAHLNQIGGRLVSFYFSFGDYVEGEGSGEGSVPHIDATL